MAIASALAPEPPMSKKARMGKIGSAATKPIRRRQRQGHRSLLPRLVELPSEICAPKSPGVGAFPNVVVAFWVDFQIVLAFGFKNIREPRIVAPISLNDDCIIRLVLTQKLINRILFKTRVPTKPNFRFFLADRGAKQSQATLGQRLRSSTQHRSKPSNDLIDSALWSCIPS